MGEQHRLRKLRLAAGDDRVDRDAGQGRQPLQRAGLEGQRHQRRPGFGHAPGRTARRCHSRSPSRPSSGSTCRRWRPPAMRMATATRSSASANAVRGPVDALDARSTRRNSTPRSPHLRQQHVDDLVRRAVAEQLAERLLVLGDAVALDQRDEVALRVAAQRRDAEVRIGRDEVLRAGVEVGEVAAPAAGDADLLAGRARWSSTSTERPRLPASMAHIMPAAPAPITTTSKDCIRLFVPARLALL